MLPRDGAAFHVATRRRNLSLSRSRRSAYLLFAALPLVVGSPKSWIAFTLPQALIAAKDTESTERGASSFQAGLKTRRRCLRGQRPSTGTMG